MTEQIVKTHLKNGLTVHLKEIHTSPIISHWVWYRVGSRDEVPGITGVSHWVEHMQFKGTPTFPSGVLDKAISRDGGFWNAFTFLDWTTYFETMPVDKIELAIKLEADRMTNSLFEEEEVESERTVIISEREGGENEPLFRLGEAVQAASFETHPYRYEIIGDKEDLNRMKRNDLYCHYRSYYAPNNAVLAMAGDFDTKEMLTKIEAIYGQIPAREPAVHPAVPEPFLQHEKRIDVKGPGETAFLQLAYRSPSGSDPDFYAFTILDSLLTGPTGLNMFGGGGISNKTSRLYRLLVEKELAVSIHGGLQATIDPFLYQITATIHPDSTSSAVLNVIDDEIKRVQDQLVSSDEIIRAAKQAKALFAYGSENITNQGFWLGYAEMFDHYDWFTEYVSNLEKVTASQVQAIAQKYLAPSTRVVGNYLPGEEA